MSEIRVPYSNEQWNALVDRMYGIPYGVEYGSYEYVAKYLKVEESKVASLRLDDAKLEYIVTLKD